MGVLQNIRGYIMRFSLWQQTRELKEGFRQLDEALAQSAAATDRAIQTSHAVKQVAERLQKQYQKGSRNRDLSQ